MATLQIVHLYNARPTKACSCNAISLIDLLAADVQTAFYNNTRVAKPLVVVFATEGKSKLPFNQLCFNIS